MQSHEVTGHESHSERYNYTALDDPSKDIRLLRIHWSDSPYAPLVCSLDTYWIREAPDYEALSYVWGNASLKEPLHIIAEKPDAHSDAGSRTVEVSINLATALRGLRNRESFDWKSKKMMVWADAICINQSWIPERNKQIRILHKIYASAKSVWIYPIDTSATIGDIYTSSNIEVHTMSRRHKSFFSETYWSRAWCVQEIFFAKEVWILYDGKEARADFRNWKPGTPLVTGLGFLGQPPRHLQSEIYHLKKIKYTELVDASSGPHQLYSLLWQCRNRRASLEQDRIYSLMNILPTSSSILQDYRKPAAAVYSSFMKEVISVGSHHIPCRPLDFLAPTHNIETPHNTSLPSWCPDFSEYADSVDVLDNVPANQSNLASLDRHRGRTPFKPDDYQYYQPWFNLRSKYKSDGQLTEPLPNSGGAVTIPYWDLPYTPLLCVAAMLNENDCETELTIQGIRLDTISQLGENLRLHSTECSLATTTEDALKPWIPMVSGVYRATPETLAPASLAFIKLLLTNSRLSEGIQATAARILRHTIFATNQPSLTPKSVVDEYLAELKACLPGWRFGISQKGYYVKVPCKAQEGDVIVVPLGSSTPFVLRKKEANKFELVGRCFVHGYMGGKAMSKLNVACQNFIGGKLKNELSEDDWKGLKEIVNRELEGFTLI